MAISISSNQGLGAYLANRDNLNAVELVGKALAGNESCARKLAGEPDFVIDLVATTDTSDGEAVDLTDQGVTFAADTIRKIRGRSYMSSPDDHYWYEWEEDVLGGTTPVLMGQKIVRGGADQAAPNAGQYEYGANLCYQATITALTTLDVVYASKGYTLGDITAGDAAFVVPRNRLFIPVSGMLTGPSSISATAGAPEVVVFATANLDGLGAGTAGVSFLAVEAAGTAASPALGGQVCLAFEVWPPCNHRLVMDSNNVTVKCTAVNANTGDDSLRHRVEIWVDKAQPLQHTT